MKNCLNCNAQNNDDALFCVSCGSQLGQQLSEQASQHAAQQGVIGVRSGCVLFQFLVGWILFFPSLALTIWFMLESPFIGVLFLALDLYTLTMLLYFTAMLVTSPKNRIEFTGGELVLYVSRRRTERINPRDIISTTGKNGNWFFNGTIFIADGTVTVTTAKETFILRFIRQSITVHRQLEAIRVSFAPSPYSSNTSLL